MRIFICINREIVHRNNKSVNLKNRSPILGMNLIIPMPENELIQNYLFLMARPLQS